MINQTEKLTETLAKAIELTCEKISKQSHQIAELGKETRTGIDIHISFDLSDFDTCVWLPTVSVENTYYGVDSANIGDLLNIYYGKENENAEVEVQDGQDTNPYWECGDIIAQTKTIVPAEKEDALNDDH